MDIGVVTISHDKDGNMGEAYFKPTMQVSLDKSLVPALTAGTMASTDNPEYIRNQADIVMASFFSKITEIELADRDKYELKSEIIQCSKWGNGAVRTCKIKYSFVKI